MIRSRLSLLPALALALALGAPAPVAARPAPPFAARAGFDLAADAARAWAPDAYLIYVENDEPLDEAGSAPRWGYLFFSPSLDKARVYSVRDARIVVAEPLDMKFQSPPLEAGWMDSGAALAAADRKIGHVFRREKGGQPATMLLLRGALQDGDPDATCWMLIYTAPDVPSLFVVVNAADGSVRRTWRG